MFYIYILYSEKFDKFYIGHTNNVERRVVEHNTNPRMTFTHKFRPWKLVASFKVTENRKNAMKLENYIKKQKTKALIRNLIDPAFLL